MENKSHAVAAGIFVLVVAAMLAGLAVWLTRDNAQYREYELSTKDGVSGLPPQAVVRYKGVPVGKVRQIGFDTETPGNVLIRIAVNDEAPISARTFAQLGYQGVTGLAHVQLDDADAPQPPIPAGPSALPRLPLRSSPLSRLSEQGPAILGQVDEAMRRINLLLGDENQKKFSTALDGVGQAARGAAALTQRLDATVQERLDPALAALPPLAGDARKTLQSLQQAGAQVSSLATDIRQTTQRLNAEGGAIDQITLSTQALARNADQFGTSTLPRVNRVAEEASRTVRQFGRMAGGIGDNPQQFIFGAGQPLAGPGEPGFEAPKAQP